MKTFETEKNNIPEGATHYSNETTMLMLCWFMESDGKWWVRTCNDAYWHECEHNENERYDLNRIPQTNIETPEEKEALDLIDTTPHQYEMSKFSGNKPRTKVEYVKCEFIKLSDAAKAVDGGDIQFNKFGNQPINDMALALHYYNNGTLSFYRRIETPITEREAFIYTYGKVRNEFANQSAIVDFCEFMYNSGQFKLVEQSK